MYRSCLHCASDLGRNEAIEHFLVGRRLAFDSAKVQAAFHRLKRRG